MVSNVLRFGVKVAVSAALIWLILTRVDLADVMAKFRAVSLSGAILVVCVLLLQCVVASVRWEWVIRTMGHHFPFVYALRAWMIGHFLGQGFPSTLGHDAFRMISLRRGGVPALDAFEIILLDRFTGVVALVALAAVTLPLFFGMAADTAPLLPLGLLITGATLGIGLVFSRVSLPGVIARFPGAAFASRLRSSLRLLIETRRHVLWMLAPALAAHLLTVIAAYIIADDGSTQIGFLQCLVIIPPALLMSMIPLSIAGWGIREGAVVAGGLLLGIPSANALFVSITLGLGFLAVGMIGGVVWLVGGGKFSPIIEGGGEGARPRGASQNG